MMNREIFLKDKDYWQGVIKTLTPYEAPEMVSVILEERLLTDLLLTDLFSVMDAEEIVGKFKKQDLIHLIEAMATREDIVDCLRECNKTDWCYEGKVILKRMVSKRKEFLQLKLKLQEASHE